MYFDKFNALSEKQKQEGRKNPSAKIASRIKNEYCSRYIRTEKTSSQIVHDLSAEFPKYNVPEALRQIMNHSRE